MIQGHKKAAWSLIVLAVLVALLARLMIGSTQLGWPVGEHAGLLLEIRLHRLAMAGIVGLSLSVSGVALQALLRNPLAEPYILGLSTGAGLGIMAQGFIALQLGLGAVSGHLGALLGTLLTLAIVFVASRRHGVIVRLGLLLVGVVLGTINGTLIMLLNYLAGPGVLRDHLAHWMMGMLQVRPLGWLDGIAAGVCVVAWSALFWRGRALDIATLNEDEAVSMGVHVGRLKVMMLLIASVLTATAVLIAGPIVFIGLIAPHLARLLIGPAHRPLLLASAMIGMALLVIADVASDTAALAIPEAGQIPIGIFTAILGGPVFLWMLRPQLGRGIQ